MNTYQTVALICASAFTALSGCGGSAEGSGSAPPVSVISSANAQPAPAASKDVPVPDIDVIQQQILQGATRGTGGNMVRGSTEATQAVAGAILAKDAAGKAVGFGWNYLVPSYCVGTPVGGIVYLYMSFRDGSYIWTSDPTAIAALGAACVSAPLIGLRVTAFTGTFLTWDTLVVYHQ